jgi:hypothetical protein
MRFSEQKWLEMRMDTASIVFNEWRKPSPTVILNAVRNLRLRERRFLALLGMTAYLKLPYRFIHEVFQAINVGKPYGYCVWKL